MSHINTDVEPRKEIYTYKAPWTIYGLAWSSRADPTSQFRLALGSYIDKYSNQVQIVKKRRPDQEMDVMQQQQQASAINSTKMAKDKGVESYEFYNACTFDHPYPCTKIMFAPGGSSRDILATTGDYLRLWSLREAPGSNYGQLTAKKEVLLNNNKNSEYCAPLTGFDWNEFDPTMIGTSSIDSTCTIWDIESNTARTQLIAHDKEVFDIAFARGKDVFASVGADGSVRMFDLRSLEHSTIIYESPGLDPLLRLSWNKCDPNYIATFMLDSNRTIVLDIRVPSVPVVELGGHMANVNALAWAPQSSCHICTAGEDWQALIWELSKMTQSPVEDPILAYNAEGEINNLLWSSSQPDWVSIAFGDKLQILRV
uniref:Uncharacterized protein n=1 Tax=Leptocylindrus danicus TaxID=163516 RepID=A0A7S2KXX1_9STRA|mmetsp:Transcript_28469/g.41902  ORF Transcript_28469/g.41902 Transcript_28469/m.41902 type:complete len:370 (+) Transcript_28469:191-1300(+)|eukprot:CAMPEP_0116041774 /NCGR_PEP_ID=MMETSP0321-20121206/25265_1 /TAXON_ID=163516 /ORGANISM="Leptocylindrus danicus var. danicus, Strain B650" /LENGTH=369 /DNA_ID=CAMNT_0003522065 /DNA_START=100 /DNA_END=1209 /DNA_ORIENTATION=+